MEENKSFWTSVRQSKIVKFLKLMIITWPVAIGLVLWHLIKPDQFDYYITEHIHPDRRKSKK